MRHTLLLALLALATLLAPSPADAAVITAATYQRDGAVVELRFRFRGRPPRWQVSAHDRQLWIDLTNTRLKLPPGPLGGQNTAPLRLVRAIDDDAGNSRLIVEVDGGADYAIGRMPHQILLRLAPAGAVPDLAAPVLVTTDRVRSAESAGRPAAPDDEVAAANLIASVPQAQPDKALPAAPPADQIASIEPPAPTQPANSGAAPIVMIDPGHGGYDPGTEAAGNVAEKDIALQIAIRLQHALKAGGIDARLTRSSDVFISLADRTRIANRANADLFVSIHLNSSPDAATAGIETYYLNNTTDRATIRLAQMENTSGGGYGAGAQPGLNYILTDMRQQYKAIESASLARMIEAQAAAQVVASLGINVNALGAMQGPFYVLVGAQMPAVLVECGFLSNATEAGRLESAQYQDAIATGIAGAIVHYLKADAAVGNL